MRNLVVTLGIGEIGRRYLDLSEPLMKAYAERIGADFQVITEAESSDPLMVNFEKFQIRHFFRDYERILYLDADVIVLPGARDIFLAVPPGEFAAWDESSMVTHSPWVQEIQRKLGHVPQWRSEYFNAGILVAARCHAHLFEPVGPEPILKMPLERGSGHYSDQSYLNWKLARSETRCFSLPVAWNWNPICGYVHPAAHFVHFLGSGFFEPARDRQSPPQDRTEKRLRQMRNLVSSLGTEVAPAELAVDLCVTSIETRSCVPLPRYLLPAGTYEVELRLRPGKDSPKSAVVRCLVFGKKSEELTVAEWWWPVAATTVTRGLNTQDLEYPQFCFDSAEQAARVESLKIKWLGDLPQSGPGVSADAKSRAPGARLQHALARILRPRKRLLLCNHGTAS